MITGISLKGGVFYILCLKYNLLYGVCLYANLVPYNFYLQGNLLYNRAHGN